MIVVQSKFYESTELGADHVAGELYKINETLKKLQNNKISEFNEKVVSAYRNASSQMEGNGSIRIVFFTSYQPKNKREQNKLAKSMGSYFEKYDLELNFRSDIEAQIELCDNGKLCVDYDKITIDDTDNYLKYKDSIIVNISALSLQDLQNRRKLIFPLTRSIRRIFRTMSGGNCIKMSCLMTGKKFFCREMDREITNSAGQLQIIFIRQEV